jgi:hypothetical protein
MMRLYIFLVVALQELTSVYSARFPVFLQRRCVAAAAVCGILGNTAGPVQAAMDKTLEDQLKVVQALQVEAQIDSVNKQRQVERESSAMEQKLIATGIVAIPPPSGIGIDSTQYPLGYGKVSMLDEVFDNKDAALIITAVPRDGPPFAAKIIRNLKSVSFPAPFTITTDDLLFPYTENAWKSSPNSKAPISLTAILDEDGRLSTPSVKVRFGFATAPVQTGSFAATSKDVSEAVLDYGAGVGEGASFKLNKKNGKLHSEESKAPPADAYVQRKDSVGELPQRREAKISIYLRADGSPYSPSELELLEMIDSFLATTPSKEL